MAGNTMRYNFFFFFPHGVIHTKVPLSITSCTCKYQHTWWARQWNAMCPAGRSQIIPFFSWITAANAQGEWVAYRINQPKKPSL